MMRTILKYFLPKPVRALLRRAKDRVDFVWMGLKDRSKYAYYRLLLLPRARSSRATLDYAEVHNTLPNSGPIPLQTDGFRSAHEVLMTFHRGIGGIHRKLPIPGFEGFALDDALFDRQTERWILWRCAPLAGLLARFAFEKYKDPSILDLGCGPALYSVFWKRYGLRNYIGVDGNPLLLKLNDHLKEDQHHFHLLNLQQEIRLCEGERPLKFDVVSSFEVLEHLQEDCIDHFIKTVCNHMHAASTAFLTASKKPETETDVHVLVRDRNWWVDRFARFGLFPRADEAELCRQLERHHPWNWDSLGANIFALRKWG